MGESGHEGRSNEREAGVSEASVGHIEVDGGIAKGRLVADGGWKSLELEKCGRAMSERCDKRYVDDGREQGSR